ncbi:MAG: hypothetical protein JSV62_14700 [Promethearchaeota archaeon]|nr:MAG: hypothetical protein JSV62_14700 [Candidatus Lokiarchaeota archaeon]
MEKMYLFKDKDIVEVPITCKICLKEIKFPISVDEYKEITKFPIQKENIHGDPSHKLIVFINQYLEVENFEIIDIIEKAKDVSYSKELAKQVLSEIDLLDEEIDLYFRTTGREAVSIGEMSILTGKSKEECKEIAEKFVDKGLFKEIVGATPHYQALPPYAALIAQTKKFYTYISDIKSKIPKQLDVSFTKLETEAEGMEKLKDSSEAMIGLKEKMLSQIQAQKKEFDETISAIDQIRTISEDISQLGDITKTLSDDQLGSLSKQFETLNVRTSQIIKNQVDELRDQFGDIKNTITENLQKLRLGVIQQAVGDVIDKVIASRLKDITDSLNVQLSVSQTVFADELKKATQGLNTEVISKLKDSLQDAVKNIDSITSRTGEDKERIFSELSDNFNKAVKLAEQRIDGLSGGIFQSFDNIKDIFGKGIVDTLDNTLTDILNRLEVSEITTREFWEQAKGVRGITMKDIWFIRSPEAAKAHINEEISKAKMRVLIVAPNLSDIDIDSIKARPSRINFRIATYIDPTLPEHEAMMNEMDKMDNVDYRNRALQNLWGINKDYEEVILCVLSKTEFRREYVTEIAGIGSIIEEHIKIFVPILEDAWVGARKEVMRTIKKPILEEPLKEEPFVTTEAITIPPEEKEIEEEAEEAPKPTILSQQFDEIVNNLEKMTGTEISLSLERFQNEYVKLEGYNSVLKNLHNASKDLKSNPEILSRPEREELKLSMKIWKQKLNL